MNKKQPNISLALLLLNDLFHINAIDKDIYDNALQKLTTLHNNVSFDENSVPASA